MTTLTRVRPCRDHAAGGPTNYGSEETACSPELRQPRIPTAAAKEGNR